ncbi:MAG: PH domain-containing protein [Phycisphaerales bacterium]
MEPPAATKDPVLRVAAFNPLYRHYLVVTIGLTMVVTIIGIPLALIWFLGVGHWWAGHYFHKLSCTLSRTNLRFRKGILFQVEKTIPLENIQDVTFIEGPILKRFNLATLKFETAGHSAGQAHDMHLTGIIDAHEFRNQIIEAREALRDRSRNAPSAPLPGAAEGASQPGRADTLTPLLTRIAAQLDEITELLRRERP